MVHPWTLLDTQQVYSRRPIFNVLEKHYRKPGSPSEAPPFRASVLSCPNWVNIIAINPAGEILLEKQFRFGTDRIELEIPGGVIEPNELPLHAAQRELEEETGYISSAWKQIGVVAANPAIMSNSCYTYLAEAITSTGETHFDPDEDIEYFFASKSEVARLLKSGGIVNAYVVAAFHWLALKDNQ
jgi:8-oxo-dGTP pyrophosphatase MutT (NUDIX family)